MHLISNMLSSIKNACLAGHEFVVIRWSKLNESIVKALIRDGYLVDYSVFDKKSSGKKVEFKYMKVRLKYDDRGIPVLRYLRMVSKPSVRVYQSRNGYKTREQYGTLIVTTSQGVMSHLDAKVRGIGGEVLCEVGC